MTMIHKSLLAAAVLSSAVFAAAAPASAAVHIGIGIGLPGPAPAPAPDRWCFNHPRACADYGPGPGFVPVIGTYYRGHGWWDGRAWYHDRFRVGGHWRYR